MIQGKTENHRKAIAHLHLRLLVTIWFNLLKKKEKKKKRKEKGTKQITSCIITASFY